MFVISTPEWPTRVVVLRPTYDGARRTEFEIVLGMHPRAGVARDCEKCSSRILSGSVYINNSGLWIWHVACLLDELRARCTGAARDERWALLTIEWGTTADTTNDV